MQEPCQNDALALVPAWHTRLLLGWMLAVGSAGALLEAPPAPSSRLLGSYLPLIAVALVSSLYVARVGLPRSTFAELWGRAAGLSDAALAIALALLVITLEQIFTTVWSLPESIAAHRMLPITTGEKVAWLVIGLVVGVSEELVFRGYLQRRLVLLTGRVAWGILLQALLFGIVHGEQGGLTVARFAVYGALFGAVSAWRRGLASCVLAHAAIDWWAGLGA